VHAWIENASNIKKASRIIVFFTLQMYDSHLAIDFKGNAKESEEGQPQSVRGAVLKFAPLALGLEACNLNLAACFLLLVGFPIYLFSLESAYVQPHPFWPSR
jgi:hypothetical protein